MPHTPLNAYIAAPESKRKDNKKTTLFIDNTYLIASLVNLVLWRVLEVVCEAQEVGKLNEQLGRVIVVPPDAVLVREGKRVVEAMVAFAESQERRDKVVLQSQ